MTGKANIFFDIGCLDGFRDLSFFGSRSLFKIHHAFARGMLGCVLRKLYNISIDKITIKKSKYGKPFLFSNPEDIKIGISHCEYIIAVVVSDCETGIDVEKVEKLQNDVFIYFKFSFGFEVCFLI